MPFVRIAHRIGQGIGYLCEHNAVLSIKLLVEYATKILFFVRMIKPLECLLYYFVTELFYFAGMPPWVVVAVACHRSFNVWEIHHGKWIGMKCSVRVK